MRLAVLVASVILAIVINTAAAGEIDNKYLQCLTCRTAIKEIKNELGKVDPKRNIDVGNYRLDGQGNEIKKTIRMARSAVHISDVLDGACAKLDDYVRATFKSNGKLTILSLLSPKGGMNPNVSKVDIIQDGDLNKSLRYLCEEVISDREEQITQLFQEGHENIADEVCGTECDDSIPDDEVEQESTGDNFVEKTEL